MRPQIHNSINQYDHQRLLIVHYIAFILKDWKKIADHLQDFFINLSLTKLCANEKVKMKSGWHWACITGLPVSLHHVPLPQIIYLVTPLPPVQIAFDCNKLPSEFSPHKWLLNRDVEWSDDVLIVTCKMYLPWPTDFLWQLLFNMYVCSDTLGFKKVN